MEPAGSCGSRNCSGVGEGEGEGEGEGRRSSRNVHLNRVATLLISSSSAVTHA